MYSNIFTKSDQERYDEILNDHPEYSVIESNLEEKFKLGQEFKMHVGSNWIERQFAHIVASKNKWHSKKIMCDYNYGCYNGRCSRCYWLVEEPENYGDFLAYCCNFCDGVCPNKCRYKDAWTSSSGKAWTGHIFFSPTPISLGRKTRKDKKMEKF